MLCERILFIIERISDILNFDNGRNQILPLCQELSHDDRMAFLELHSAYRKPEILETRSDDEIRRILESCSDDVKKQNLKMYLFHMCRASMYTRDPDRDRLINLYLPDFDKTRELVDMYRELSDDDKEEFLHKYTDSWRYKILKHLEFRPRWFPKYHWRTLFDVITLLTEGKEVVLSKDVKEGIGELQKWLRRIYNYLRDRQVLSEYEQQLYFNLSYIADSSDDFLDRVMSHDVTAHDIHTILQTIHNFYSYNLSSTPFKSNVIVQGNINIGGTQNIANSNLATNHSEPSNNNYSRPKTYGHVPNPDLVGFNHEIQLLLNHLLQPQDETRVVGIVGAGGSGKTTLAKHIYHHPQINTRFTRVGVCLSQSWDKTSILKQIWQQVHQDPEATKMNYDEVVYKLSQLLSSHSYLIILDNIWSIKAWYDISPALPPRSGSKVVVTTRNKCLPHCIDPSVLIVEPKQLNDEECYELFKKRALLDENDHHELKSLGMKMVEKCKGLPLAVVALAGVLGIDKRLSSWERISKRVTDKMLGVANKSTQGVVKEILALSYYELPQNIKPCALYLHVFPEEYEIQAQTLIQMWIAELFMDEEFVAEEYIDELAQRCIVEVIETDHKGQVLEFRIHDLIRQMLTDINKEKDKNPVLRLVPRITLYGDGQKYFDSQMKILDRYLYGNPHARSLIFLKCEDHPHGELKPLFIKLKFLRVLIIDDVPWSWLPKEIGNLIHLRYLELRGEPRYIPRSIGNLENLLTLDFRKLNIFMEEIINLEKLKEPRHLYIASLYLNMKITVIGLEKLKKLKTLWVTNPDEFQTWKLKSDGLLIGEDGWMFSVMPKLSDVLQELSVQGIRDQKELEVMLRIPGITSNNLHTLELNWVGVPPFQLRDMSNLSKCKCLDKLKLIGRIQKGTPLMFPPNLIHLELRCTFVEEKQVMNIISNSCPLLKILMFEVDAYRGKELVFNKNSFPQLEKLVFNEHREPVLWIIERGAMPRLNHLMLRDNELLELNDQGWERISKIPKLIFLDPPSHTTIFKQKLQQWRKDLLVTELY